MGSSVMEGDHEAEFARSAVRRLLQLKAREEVHRLPITSFAPPRAPPPYSASDSASTHANSF